MMPNEQLNLLDLPPQPEVIPPISPHTPNNDALTWQRTKLEYCTKLLARMAEDAIAGLSTSQLTESRKAQRQHVELLRSEALSAISQLENSNAYRSLEGSNHG